MSGSAGAATARISGALLAGAVALAVAAFGRLPTPLNPTDDAVLRLSWRLRGSQVQQLCTRPTTEELERLPAHMRNPDACTGRVAPYRLVVELDGRVVVDDTIQGAGARHDRPIYVFRELPVESGDHRVRVTFELNEEEEEEREEAQEALELELERSLEMAPRRVVLITYDADRRRLVVRRESP